MPEGFDFLISQVKQPLKPVTEYVYTELLKAYQITTKQMGGALLNAARETDSEQGKDELITAIAEVKRMQGTMQARFDAALLAAFEVLRGNAAIRASLADADTNVQMMGDSDLIERIYLQTIIAHALSHFEKWLGQLTGCLQATLPGSGINAENNPFGPAAIGEAVFASIASLTISSDAKKQILAIYQQQIFHKLGPFYQNALRKMGQAGISVQAPGMTTATISGRTEARKLAAHQNFVLETVEAEPIEHIETVYAVKPAESRVYSEWDAVDLIQGSVIPDSIGQRNYIAMEDMAGMNPQKKETVLSTDALNELLADMQKGYDPETDGNLIDAVKAQLAIEATDTSVLVIKRHDENVINLLSLIFDYLDKTQNQEVANMLKRLKVPYARLALEDDFFFHDDKHPARQLLDALFALARSNNDDKKLFKQVQHTVMKILLRYRGNTEVFEEMLAAVKDYLQDESFKNRKTHSEISNMLEKEENKRLALSAANEFVRRKTASLHCHFRFHDLLVCLWQRILADIYLQKGTKSVDWKKAIYLLDKIVMTTGGVSSEALREELKNLPKLTHDLSVFLTEHDVELSHKTLFMDRMREIQLFLLKQKPQTATQKDLGISPQIDELLEQLSMEQLDEDKGKTIGSEHLYLQVSGDFHLVNEKDRPSRESAKSIIDTLAIGQWMMVMLNRKATACQIGFYAKSHDSYVFFDRQQMRLFERSRAKLLEDVYLGYACLMNMNESFSDILARISNDLGRKAA